MAPATVVVIEVPVVIVANVVLPMKVGMLVLHGAAGPALSSLSMRSMMGLPESQIYAAMTSLMFPFQAL
jgi:hypothetical protein